MRREKKAALRAKELGPRTSSTGSSARGPSFKDLSNSAGSRNVIMIDDDEVDKKPKVKAEPSNGNKRSAAWAIDVDLLSSDDDKPNPKAAKLGPSGGSGSSLGSVKNEGPSSASPAIVIDGANPEQAKKLRAIKLEEQRWNSLLKVYMANPESAAKLHKSGIEKCQAKLAECKQQYENLRKGACTAVILWPVPCSCVGRRDQGRVVAAQKDPGGPVLFGSRSCILRSFELGHSRPCRRQARRCRPARGSRRGTGSWLAPVGF